MKIENKEVDIDADVNQISGNPINEQYYSFNEKIEFLCSFFLLPFPLFMNSNKKIRCNLEIEFNWNRFAVCLTVVWFVYVFSNFISFVYHHHLHFFTFLFVEIECGYYLPFDIFFKLFSHAIMCWLVLIFDISIQLNNSPDHLIFSFHLKLQPIILINIKHLQQKIKFIT